jgi:hypothetical protein
MFFIIAVNFQSYSQDTIRYTYDNAGNRIGRDTIHIGGGGMLKRGKIEKPIIDYTFENREIKIYPNPTKGMLEVEIPEDPYNPETIQLLIFDLKGRPIIDRRQEPSRSLLDLSPYPNGFYILYLKKGQTISKWKIIKQ